MKQCLKRTFFSASAFALGYLLYLFLLPRLLILEAGTLPNFKQTEQQSLSINALIKGPLTYLGSGSQCFAFLTEDGQHVVKLCKAVRYRSPFKTNNLKRLHSDFSSYSHAKDLLFEQTQLVYLHLHPTKHLKSPVHFKDPFGIQHSLDLNRFAFYVQKKAIPLRPYAKGLNPEETRCLAKKLLTLFTSSCEIGLQIRDLHPKNIGIFEETPLWIDPGRIRKKSAVQQKQSMSLALAKFSKTLSSHLKVSNPELAAFIEEEHTKLLSSSF